MINLNTLKYRFKNAGIVEQLIYINLAVFIAVYLFQVVGFLFQLGDSLILVEWLSLPASFSGFIRKPWTIITYGFVHTGIIHILMNLIALYFIGHLFKQYFTGRQLLDFYLLGTLFGGILFLLSYNYFPAFLQDKNVSVLIGASAGISAIFVGVATYIPNYQLKIPLIGFVKLWHLAAVWVMLDVIQIPISNPGGRIAHLGGALFGFLYVNSASNKDLDIFKSFRNLFKQEKKSPLKTVHKSKTTTTKSNTFKNKDVNQQKVDEILDKIGKSGYDVLSKEEKEFLFKQGRK
ncbi:rhomboid family intramembrane serine protease [Tenacibaculum sp. M341]|uniref:rhomboid family intramembrane serine protease n=1 Tax=Tenacibaculum sp. M341 TaxID=2530339 RepID=UPI001053FA74|nr:rhomboid family intramembrane serine protease [Tenacibaculum sp. M341]TCI90687.1 rhomboid family intramembrane serine protease [Tenacibaculum sp. M341]